MQLSGAARAPGLLLAMLLACMAVPAAAESTLNVGSKRFTESYILGEIIAQSAQTAGEATVSHHAGLGNTAILFAALKNGAIDIYPEYSGTIIAELLGGAPAASLDDINRALAPMGLAAGVPLGFANTYALAMPAALATAKRIRTIGDLAAQPSLRVGLSQEFMQRPDGWPALKRAYRLPFNPTGLDHGLAFEALAGAQIDVTDIYTTDAKIARYTLRLLADDRGVFPRYDAMLLYRADLPQRLPATWAALLKLENKITPTRMIELNAAVELKGGSFSAVARSFTATPAQQQAAPAAGLWGRLFAEDLARLTWQHLQLVVIALGLSCAAGIPLGVWAARSSTASAVIMPAVSILQTIPSLALLAMLIALFNQIGSMPAIFALFLYGLLPIVRNTATGLATVSAHQARAAAALGLGRSAILRLIELPLAARTILAGIRTSAVINVGTATIAAFIGAGGYGERIVAGLAVNDNAMLLAGALPATAMALAFEALFGWFERRLPATMAR